MGCDVETLGEVVGQQGAGRTGVKQGFDNQRLAAVDLEKQRDDWADRAVVVVAVTRQRRLTIGSEDAGQTEKRQDETDCPND
jgi:hypothetical protein